MTSLLLSHDFLDKSLAAVSAFQERKMTAEAGEDSPDGQAQEEAREAANVAGKVAQVVGRGLLAHSRLEWKMLHSQQYTTST